ncbi:hypothetical protein K504DRAFT_242495 [Pleomassaria siparia CBS 279.74]|uniref:Uncharacterized protein n=1 Tax=Pleomassaria siparia CBS 279.74 TaxID=1314801 RepID=A0A6G1KF74_9PLEO|nr:hypothetical protein K504DRAFT_242495 [Pleomassaria siparia CBS 279.74]
MLCHAAVAFAFACVCTCTCAFAVAVANVTTAHHSLHSIDHHHHHLGRLGLVSMAHRRPSSVARRPPPARSYKGSRGRRPIDTLCPAGVTCIQLASSLHALSITGHQYSNLPAWLPGCLVAWLLGCLGPLLHHEPTLSINYHVTQQASIDSLVTGSSPAAASSPRRPPLRTLDDQLATALWYTKVICRAGSNRHNPRARHTHPGYLHQSRTWPLGCLLLPSLMACSLTALCYGSLMSSLVPLRAGQRGLILGHEDATFSFNHQRIPSKALCTLVPCCNLRPRLCM